MPATSLRIGLATTRVATSRAEALAKAERFMSEAAAESVSILCFPETYLPGYRGLGFPTPPPDQAAQERALQQVCELAHQLQIAAIVPMEWAADGGLLNLAFVIDADGTIQGCQTKNQLPVEEEPYYVPGETRRLFTIEGVPFGIVICHEGARYPETVRWAAQRGARIVFHPQLTGTDEGGTVPRYWGDPDAPYYEKAMVARAVENEIYFASVNYAFRYPESATSVVAPDGRCLAHAPYGEETLLVVDLDLEAATGRYAQRYAPGRYREWVPSPGNLTTFPSRPSLASSERAEAPPDLVEVDRPADAEHVRPEE